MNLRSVDLNLLVIFDALLAERNVTRAAVRVAMSQPAMSNALARLRHVFKDELFVRCATGVEPTPRALELGTMVHELIRQTERLLTSEIDFDPATTSRIFRARMSDLIGFLALPNVVAALRPQAPSVGLEVVHISPQETVRALELDHLDFALSMNLDHGPSIRSAPLFTDQMVFVMRSGHALEKGRMTLKQFVAADHLRVAMSPTDIRFVDDVLRSRGLRRNIVLTVAHWLLVPPVLKSTDLVSVVSAKLASRFVEQGLAARALPFKSANFSWRIYWHRRHESSKPHQWMRALIARACSGI